MELLDNQVQILSKKLNVGMWILEKNLAWDINSGVVSIYVTFKFGIWTRSLIEQM